MNIAVEPENWRQSQLQDAVRAAGGNIVPVDQAQALVWGDSLCGELAAMLHDDLNWVQLPWAGIEPFVDVLDSKRQWTCGKGIYSAPVAEHTLALMLACLHRLPDYARARQWTAQTGDNLYGKTVLILGAGGITEQLLKLLQPFSCNTVVLRRKAQPYANCTRSDGIAALHEELPKADFLILALSLTAQTRGIIGAQELAKMKPTSSIVNVARGAHIVTDDLQHALAHGQIESAALDVTDPEPLPDGHPLWQLPNCLITPHTGNTPSMGIELLCEHVEKNVRRYLNGEPLLAPVDIAAGY